MPSITCMTLYLQNVQVKSVPISNKMHVEIHSRRDYKPSGRFRVLYFLTPQCLYTVCWIQKVPNKSFWMMLGNASGDEGKSWYSGVYHRSLGNWKLGVGGMEGKREEARQSQVLPAAAPWECLASWLQTWPLFQRSHLLMWGEGSLMPYMHFPLFYFF